MKKLRRLLSRRRSSRLGAAPPDPSPAVPSPPKQRQEAKTGLPDRPPQRSKFEQLPFDIHHHILLAVDTIEDLGALVRASPDYHQQYVRRRGFWLWRCLWLETGPALVDAHAAYLCGSLKFQQGRSRESIQDFVAAYDSRRSTASEISSNPPSTAEDIVEIVAFHSSIVRPLLQHYVTWTRGNLDVLSTPESLSRAEQERILRGLYRFEICCQLFGWSQFHRASSRSYEQMRRLLCIYEPWESEEILCINLFSDSRVDSALDAVRWNLHPDNPRWDETRTDPFTPDGAFDIDLDRELYRNGIVSLGLSHLYTICTLHDHARLLQAMSDNMVTLFGDWMAEAANSARLEERRETHYSERDRAQDRREKMAFSGDEDNSPPLAWVSIWRGTYSNLWGCYLIPDSLRSWGFVMWDGRRLEESGALAMLDQEWKKVNTSREDGEIYDPRDPYGDLGYMSSVS